MASDQAIQIDVLRKTINGILDFIEKDLALSEVELGKDHYWEALDRYLADMPQSAQMGAGSLADDWEFLMSAAKNKEQQLPVMLVHVAPILHALSQAVPSYKAPDQSEK